MLNSSAVNVRFVNDGMTYFMSNLMQLMVSGGASELHPRVGMSHLEELTRYWPQPLDPGQVPLAQRFAAYVISGSEN